MLNQVVLVGRLKENPKTTKLEDGKDICTVIISVKRSSKNLEGLYETDYIKCTLCNSLASNASEYCKKGDIVGIKGRIQTNRDKTTEIVAEKITFLAGNKAEDN